MKYKYLLILFLLLLISCSDDKNDNVSGQDRLISAMDISSLPEIEMANPVFLDLENHESGFLDIIKAHGVNTIRLRLWVDPPEGHSGFNEVKQFSETLKALGFKIWLSLHLSDTWADPGQQITPLRWQGLEFSNLLDSVYSYTDKVMTGINPEYIQIGNEVNSGFLHPQGNISTNPQQFLQLMQSGILAVRDNSTSTKIILHYAGTAQSEWFFNQVNSLDYDIIGLSYYPLWHGKDINDLRLKLQTLSQDHNKDIVIAETAYPFTLNWNDWTNNIMGLETQLILPDFPATPKGQQDFIKEIKHILEFDSFRPKKGVFKNSSLDFTVFLVVI